MKAEGVRMERGRGKEKEVLWQGAGASTVR